MPLDRIYAQCSMCDVHRSNRYPESTIMAVTLDDFIRDLTPEEQASIAKRAFELRAELADLDTFDRIMVRPTPAPDLDADRVDDGSEPTA